MKKPYNHNDYTRRWRHARQLADTARQLGFEAYAKGTKCRVHGVMPNAAGALEPCSYLFECDGETLETVRHVAKQGARKRLERNPITDMDLRQPDVFRLWATGEKFKPAPEEWRA